MAIKEMFLVSLAVLEAIFFEIMFSDEVIWVSRCASSFFKKHVNFLRREKPI